MNKQELIEKYKSYEGKWGAPGAELARQIFIEDLKLLDEPETGHAKVTIPQFVADWYEEHKDNLEYNIWDWMKYNLEPKKRENVIFSQWLGKTVNNPVETLIKMKLNGYEVEKEKRYSVKIRGKIEENLLVYGLGINRYFFARTYDSTKRNEHTREQLEKAGFEWVFDCQGIEIKEVE